MDISLSDIMYVGGGLLLVALCSALFTHREEVSLLIMARRARRASAGDDYGGSGTGSANPVLAQQHQAEPELVPNFTRALAYISQHNFTSDEAADVLASIKVGDDYLLSANKIRDIVGGNEAAVKARVAARRPKVALPKPSARLERPANGWGKAS